MELSLTQNVPILHLSPSKFYFFFIAILSPMILYFSFSSLILKNKRARAQKLLLDGTNCAHFFDLQKLVYTFTRKALQKVALPK